MSFIFIIAINGVEIYSPGQKMPLSMPTHLLHKNVNLHYIFYGPDYNFYFTH